MSIGIVATLKIQEGKQAEFEAAFGEMLRQVRANEAGCQLYTLTLKRGTTTEYVVMELYKDQAAVDLHGKTDYFRAGFKIIGPLLDGPPAVSYLDVKI